MQIFRDKLETQKFFFTRMYIVECFFRVMEINPQRSNLCTITDVFFLGEENRDIDMRCRYFITTHHSTER